MILLFAYKEHPKIQNNMNGGNTWSFGYNSTTGFGVDYTMNVGSMSISASQLAMVANPANLVGDPSQMNFVQPAMTKIGGAMTRGGIGAVLGDITTSNDNARERGRIENAVRNFISSTSVTGLAINSFAEFVESDVHRRTDFVNKFIKDMEIKGVPAQEAQRMGAQLMCFDSNSH